MLGSVGKILLDPLDVLHFTFPFSIGLASLAFTRLFSSSPGQRKATLYNPGGLGGCELSLANLVNSGFLFLCRLSTLQCAVQWKVALMLVVVV